MVRGAHTAAMPPTPDPDVLDEQRRAMMQRRATTRLASEMVLNHGANTNSNTTHAHDDDDDDDGDNPEPRGCLPNRGSKQKARRAEGNPGNPGNPGDHAVVIVRPAATAAARRRNRADTPPTASNRFEPIAPFEPDKSDAFAVVVLFLLLLGVVACAVAFPYQGVLDLDADRWAFERTLLRWVAAREALAAEARGEALAPFPNAEAAAPFSGIEAFLAPARNA